MTAKQIKEAHRHQTKQTKRNHENSLNKIMKGRKKPNSRGKA
jgi:hypothetical protein